VSIRLLKHCVYFSLLAGAIAVGWPRFALLGQALACDACYFPWLPEAALWLPLAGLILGYTCFFLLGAVRGWRIGLLHHAAVLVLFGAILFARILEGTDPAERHPDPPPAVCLSVAAGRLQTGLARQTAGGRPLPDTVEAVEALVAGQSGPPLSGLRGHGFPLAVEVRVVTGASGPALDVLHDRPGTIVYAVHADRRRYWITLVGMEQAPRGAPSVLRGEDGLPLILSATDLEVHR